MKKISFLKIRLRQVLLSFAFLFGLSFHLQAQNELGLSVVTTQNGNEVTADFLMYNFTDILSYQFSIQWDPSQLEFVEISEYGLQGLTGANFGTFDAANGTITASWFDATLEGVSVPNCQAIFTFKYTLVGSTIPAITINENPTAIEVVQIVNGNDVQMDLVQNMGCENIGTLSGKIFNDTEFDCSFDGNEDGLNGWIIQAVGNGFDFYRSANADGNFNFYVPEGNYEVNLILPPNNYWSACELSQNVEIVSGETADMEFAAQAVVSCSALSVDLSAAFLLRCFPSTYHINYCNDGTIEAEDAYVELELDDALEIIGSSIPWTTVNGATYTFPVGPVGIGECASFQVEVMVSCESELGATHCSEVTIFPNDPCNDPSPLWDGSSIVVDGECNGDEVVFTITNVGDDMQGSLEFVIIEDDMMAFPPTTFQLSAMESTTASFVADGTSYRMQVEQAENHPGLSMPSASVEGCIDGAGTVSLGFVGQFPQDDLDPWVDVDCQENVGSYDPNDKIGYPIGYGHEHYIEPETEIEYRIRFQNTGTFMAFNVTVLDTLSPLLDPATIRLGSASHPYEFDLTGEGILKFDFPGIMLPDSSSNLAGSNGYLTFKIKPRNNIPLGSKVENSAAIYFDFNDPVITNTYFHTVDEDFITQEPNAVGFTPFSDVQVLLTPNPSPDGQRPLLLVEAQNSKKLQFQLFDLEGKSLFVGENTVSVGSSLVSLPINLHRGTYFLQVTDAQNHGTALKLLVR